MPALIIEKFDSREATVGGDSPSVDLQYAVIGTELDTEVRALVESSVPAFYTGLVIQNYHIAHQGGGVWEVTVRYGKLPPREVDAGTPDNPMDEITFDTSGGTQKITQSLATVGTYGLPIEDLEHPPPIPPDFGRAIGVTADSVEGVDITVPVLNFTITRRRSTFTLTDFQAIFGLTGRVNSAAFKGFAAGEVLFLGGSGQRRGEEDWEIAYKFAASPNVTGLSIGGITGIDKTGWEYLWVRYADAVDEDTLIQRPVAVYVEKVYESGDFSLLGIGG